MVSLGVSLGVGLGLGLGVSLGCTTSPLGASASEQETPDAARVMKVDPRERRLARKVVDIVEREHLIHRRIDDALSKEAFQRYLREIDHDKAFFLRADVTALGVHADQIDDELRSGDLALAHETAALMRGRVPVVEKMVAALLLRPFDSTDDEFVETDAAKQDWASTEEELRERWRLRLELEALERIALMEDEKVEGTPQALEARARADLTRHYAARFARLSARPPFEAATTLVNAVLTAIDPNTSYLPPAEKANFDIHMSGALEGIGAVLREDNHHIRVVELVPGGPSWRDGRLEVGDLILAVGQEGDTPVDIADMSLNEVVKMIRGRKGTVVLLTVRKPSYQVETIALTRDVVVLEESYARAAVVTGADGKAYGYVVLPSFYGDPERTWARSATSDLRRLLVEMKRRKVAGIAIDLRGNGGGLLVDAVDTTGLLIDRGPVVQTRDSDGTAKVLVDEKGGTSYAGPVVILVDSISASASEILAGTVQDYGRGVVIGTSPTAGKGTVQTLTELNDGGAQLGTVKVTVRQFFRVTGISTQGHGVTPDILLPEPPAYIDLGERQLEKFAPWHAIDPAEHPRWPATWKVPDVVARSVERVTQSDSFARVNKRREVLAAFREDTRIPLARERWLARRKEQDAAEKGSPDDPDKGPARFAVLPLHYDGKGPVEPHPKGKADDRATRFQETLSRDLWVEEALNVLADMSLRR
jgi:carboxyl-terminal processing protease